MLNFPKLQPSTHETQLQTPISKPKSPPQTPNLKIESVTSFPTHPFLPLLPVPFLTDTAPGSWTLKVRLHYNFYLSLVRTKVIVIVINYIAM